MTWTSLSGQLVTDLGEMVRQLALEGPCALHIGTDSKTRGELTSFVTVLAVLRAGHGGRAFYRVKRAPRCGTLAHQLIHEVQLSIDAALALSAEIPADIVVHIDANHDQRHRSAKYVQMLSGMGLGNGFKVLLKPDAWCASHVADHVVREKHHRVA